MVMMVACSCVSGLIYLSFSAGFASCTLSFACLSRKDQRSCVCCGDIRRAATRLVYIGRTCRRGDWGVVGLVRTRGATADAIISLALHQGRQRVLAAPNRWSAADLT